MCQLRASGRRPAGRGVPSPQGRVSLSVLFRPRGLAGATHVKEGSLLRPVCFLKY